MTCEHSLRSYDGIRILLILEAARPSTARLLRPSCDVGIVVVSSKFSTPSQLRLSVLRFCVRVRGWLCFCCPNLVPLQCVSLSLSLSPPLTPCNHLIRVGWVHLQSAAVSTCSICACVVYFFCDLLLVSWFWFVAVTRRGVLGGVVSVLQGERTAVRIVVSTHCERSFWMSRSIFVSD